MRIRIGTRSHRLPSTGISADVGWQMFGFADSPVIPCPTCADGAVSAPARVARIRVREEGRRNTG